MNDLKKKLAALGAALLISFGAGLAIENDYNLLPDAEKAPVEEGDRCPEISAIPTMGEITTTYSRSHSREM